MFEGFSFPLAPLSLTAIAGYNLPAGSVNNLGTPCPLLPLPPFAMLKRLEHVLFSVRKASSLYNIERGKGYYSQRCQMSQELLSETVASLPSFSRIQFSTNTTNNETFFLTDLENSEGNKRSFLFLFFFLSR